MSESETEERRLYLSGVFLAMGGTFLFALKSIFIKLAFSHGTDTETLLALRMLLALPFYVGMLIYIFMQDPSRATPSFRLTVRVMLIGFLGYYLASFLDLKGLEYISAQLERLTLFTYPTIIALLAWMFLGEQITKRIIFALVMCYLGIFVMYSQEQSLTQGTDVGLGVMLVMGAALSFSFYVLFGKPVMQAVGSRVFTSIAMIGSTGFVLVHFLITKNIEDLNVVPSVWFYAALLAFVSTVIPSFMVSEAIVRIGATRTTILGSVGPVFTMFLAVVLLGEPTSIWHLFGTGLVIAGVAVVSLKR